MSRSRSSSMSTRRGQRRPIRAPARDAIASRSHRSFHRRPHAPRCSASCNFFRNAAMTLSPLAHHLFTMACNNAWANHRLLTACDRLSQADFVAPRTSFFPSLKATLNHNLTVDWYYVDALERSLRGQPPNLDAGRFYEPEEPFDTCAALSDAQHAVDRRLIAACAA